MILFVFNFVDKSKFRCINTGLVITQATLFIGFISFKVNLDDREKFNKDKELKKNR